jgi:hypothetical protein
MTLRRIILALSMTTQIGCLESGEMRSITAAQTEFLSSLGSVGEISLKEDTVLTAQISSKADARVSYEMVSSPVHGKLENFEKSLGSFTYTPNPNVSGVAETLSYRMIVDNNVSSEKSIKINITPVNDKPIAPEVSMNTNEDQTLTITLAATDVENSPLTYTILTQPQNATLTFDAVNKRINLVPAANFNGSVSFSYKVNDGELDSDTALVKVTVVAVNDAPSLTGGALAATQDTPVNMNVASADIDNDALTYVIKVAPLHGSVTSDPVQKRITYLPARNYFGPDTFQLAAKDATLESTPAVFTVSVAENYGDNMLTKNIIANCFNDATHNACIFWKNPVAQNGAALATPIDANSNLSALQTHGVNIPQSWLNNSGFLANPSFDVYMDTTANTAARVPANGNYKYNYGNDASHRAGQVVNFYWLNAQMRYMNQRIGNFFAAAKNIKVFAWDPTVNDNAYYSSVNNDIHIGKRSSNGNEFSLAAEIIMHEMGHANAGFATNNGIYNFLTSVHKFCVNSTDGNVCCNTRLGCTGAISEGLADYHAAILFESSPALGEHLFNNVNGFSECGVPRNAILNANLTTDDLYGSCTLVNLGQYTGEIHVMGRVWASIWYQLKKGAKAVSAADGVDLDRLFNEHLKVLTGGDDFVTAYNKIRSIDSALFANKFGAKIQAEFQRRKIIP